MYGDAEEQKVIDHGAVDDTEKLTIQPIKFSTKVNNEVFKQIKSFKVVKGDVDSTTALSIMLELNLSELGFIDVNTIHNQSLNQNGCISRTYIFEMNPTESKMRRFAIQVTWTYGLDKTFGQINVQVIEHDCRFNSADGIPRFGHVDIEESDWDHRGAWWAPRIQVKRVNSFESIWTRVVKAINKQVDNAIEREKYEVERLKADPELTGCRSWFQNAPNEIGKGLVLLGARHI